jgi:hypothetical protein
MSQFRSYLRNPDRVSVEKIIIKVKPLFATFQGFSAKLIDEVLN